MSPNLTGISDAHYYVIASSLQDAINTVKASKPRFVFDSVKIITDDLIMSKFEDVE